LKEALQQVSDYYNIIMLKAATDRLTDLFTDYFYQSIRNDLFGHSEKLKFISVELIKE